METAEKITIIVATTVKLPINEVWQLWTNPRHIKNWYNASEDWHAPYAENDFRVDGKFKTTVASKNGNEKYDFEGVYTKIKENKFIEYIINDGRKVRIEFVDMRNETHITETFEIEKSHPFDEHKNGWQAILDNFKRYCENIQVEA